MPERDSKIQKPKSRRVASWTTRHGEETTIAQRLAETAFLAVAAAFLLWSRSLNFSAPLDPDEANYGFIGARLMAGDRMYVDVWDQQPPLTFMIFGWLRQLFGPAEVTYRGFAAACSVLTLLFLYGTMRRGIGVWPAVATAVLWALISHDPGTDGDQANREVYMNTCAAGAVFCLALTQAKCNRRDEGDQSGGPNEAHRAELDNAALTASSDRRRLVAVFLSGLLLGLGSVFKVIVAVHWLLIVPWLVAVSWRSGAAGAYRRVIASLAAFATGPALIWAAHALYFAADGRLKLFLDAVILHNVGYAGGDVRAAGPGWSAFFTAEPWVFVTSRILWLSAPIGFLLAPWRSPTAALIRLYAVATLLEILLPGKFWRHYYHLLLPPLAMLTAFVVLALSRILRANMPFRSPARALDVSARMSRRAGQVGAILLTLLILTPLTLSQTFWYYSRSAEERAFLRYVIMSLWPRQIGQTAAQYSRPADTIYMHGDAVGVYYYADRRPLTKYTMASQFLLDEYAGAAARRAEVAAELSGERRARFIFLMAPPFPELEALLASEYRVICEYGQLVVVAHSSVPASELPPAAAWIWEPSDPDLIARCEELNRRYRIWHPPPGADATNGP